MNVDVVIGANYGDEGKGLTTNWLCMNSNKPIVVMTNGGCQRGHTVCNRIRHVFHHFGSGTIVGAPTYFPAAYLMNPMAYVAELNELHRKNIHPICYRSKKCSLQLPIDIFLNHILEMNRQIHNESHGSVGWGIWETTLRNKTNPILVEDFAKLNLVDRIDLCREMFAIGLKCRLTDVQLSPMVVKYANEMASMFNSDDFLRHFSDDFDIMANTSLVYSMNDVLNDQLFDKVIFENAQGLLLDETYSNDSIHSTPSFTGLNGVEYTMSNDNVDFDLLNEVDKFNVYYVSRTYLTRHGSGKFEEYDPNLHFDDQTNISNKWQGSIRFGNFTKTSIDSLKRRINADFCENMKNFDKKLNFVLTHCNELPPLNDLKSIATHLSTTKMKINII